MSHPKSRATLFTVKVALHVRWLTTEKFQSYETVKGGCIPSKNKFETQKYNKLRWLTFDLNFKLLLGVLALMLKWTDLDITHLAPNKKQ